MKWKALPVELPTGEVVPPDDPRVEAAGLNGVIHIGGKPSHLGPHDESHASLGGYHHRRKERRP